MAMPWAMTLYGKDVLVALSGNFCGRPRIGLYHSANEPGMAKFEIPRRDSSANSYLARTNWLITKCFREGRIGDARRVFDQMCERDVVTWTTVITGYVKHGMVEEARRLFDRVDAKKNVVTWTALVGYIQDGQSEEALKIFSKMLVADGVKPNEGTFVTVLGACSDLAGLSEGQQVHQMISKTVYQGCAFVVSALINMYSKCGELGAARKMFDDGLTSHRDLISWNGMIAAYAHHGCGIEAIGLFNEMRELGVQPDDVTYVGLLSACSHAGLVEEGLKYFDELVKDGSIILREDHYTCLVDLCGRAGRLKEAFDFIKRLRNKPSASIWGALLAGCNVHGDLNIGKLAAKDLLEVESKNAGTYLLLSNIYASAGKWREAANMRLKMKDKGLKKQPGCSWIEIGNRPYVFVVGDKSNSQSELICSLLHDLHGKMKKVGYVPHDDLIMDEDFAIT
ncbi:pentatricopeptide repeat-containing protein [Quercus suber]|uniref:Pentatricopeptide repeat-containing protein n=1 Tax=Quercus suber TaxID=58331 RepID=A0AAW0KX62_QUESU